MAGKDIAPYLSSFVDESGDGIILTDEQGRVVFWNRAAEQMFGRNEKDVLGRNFSDIQFPYAVSDDNKLRFYHVSQDEMSELSRRGEGEWLNQILEREIERPDGTRAVIQTVAFPIRTKKGFRIASINRDVTERKQMEAEVRSSGEQFRQLVESAPDAVFVEVEFRFVYVNSAALKLFGASSADQLLNRLVFDRLHPDSREKARERLHLLTEHLESVPLIEQIYLRMDGNPVSVEVSAVPFVFENRRGNLVFVRDITDRKQVEADLRASLEEKQVLLREIHHRVKNNMQIISSLLNIQAKNFGDPKFMDIVRASQARIRSMALIHEQLYRSQNLSRIAFTEYVQHLVVHLFNFYQADPKKVGFRPEWEPIDLDINTAIPAGLIVNELVSNALKHAFPEGRPGEIMVRLSRLDERKILLAVEDNGVGLPGDLDFLQVETMGLQIVNMLIKQLDAALRLKREGGTKIEIIFSEPKSPESA